MKIETQTNIQENLVSELSVYFISELFLRISITLAHISLGPSDENTHLDALVKTFRKKPHQRF